MVVDFAKWDIVYPTRYPESIPCLKCRRQFMINPQQPCEHCKASNHVSNIITKIRPMILWIDQTSWYKSMTFGIPLSTTGFYSDDRNHQISIPDCLFYDNKYEKPMRAILCQATRADGNALQTKHLIGKVSDEVVKREIENKLLSWIFG